MKQVVIPIISSTTSVKNIADLGQSTKWAVIKRAKSSN